MNFNGEYIITAVGEKINKNGLPPTDSNIIKAIRDLNNYELAELINFGNVSKWIRDEKR